MGFFTAFLLCLSLVCLSVNGAECGTTLTTVTHTMNTTTGQISDGSGSYIDSQTCTFIIYPTGNTKALSLNFTSFETESGYDKVAIYEGLVISEEFLLDTLMGSILDLPYIVISTKPSMTVVFTSDSSNVGTGFEAHYQTLNYTPYNCSSKNNCSGPTRGTCNVTAMCECKPGYYGVDCSQAYSCPSSNQCNGHGACILPNVCDCNDGWNGTDCSIDIDECLEDPCKNGGVCENSDGNYTCLCDTLLYSGRNCETDIPFDEIKVETLVFPFSTFYYPNDGITDAYISVWGRGGGGGFSVYTGNRYCEGGAGGSSGFTKKKVKLIPGEAYEIIVAKYYYDYESYVRLNNSDENSRLVWAESGHNGGDASILGKGTANERCNSPFTGIGGDGENIENQGVLRSVTGCQSPNPDLFGCCETTSEGGVSAGSGSCDGSPPKKSGQVFPPPGEPGLVMIETIIKRYPILTQLSYVQQTNPKVKIFDNVIVNIRLVDYFNNTDFHPHFAEKYALNTSIIMTDLSTGKSFSNHPQYSISGEFNFVLYFTFNKIGKYRLSATYEGNSFGTPMDIDVSDQIIFFPDTVSVSYSMGSSGQEKVIITNIGNQNSLWSVSLNQTYSWVSIGNATQFLNYTQLPSSYIEVPIQFVLGLSTINNLDVKVAWMVLKRSSQDPVYIPITLRPVPGATYAPTCLIQLSSSVIMIGKQISFKIIGYDQFGFKKTSGGDVFRVQSISSEGSTLTNAEFEWSCDDLANGEYSCYCSFLNEVGLYNLQVYLRASNSDVLINQQNITLQVTSIECTAPELPNTEGNKCVCPNGLYRNVNGLCDRCPEKTYKNVIGDQTCSQCPPNTVSNGTHCSCVTNAFLVNDTCKCMAGYDSSAECSSFCRSGTFSTNGKDCEECFSFGAVCKDGTLQLIPDVWWEESNFNSPTGLLRCRKEGICQSGGVTYLNAEEIPQVKCAEGHDPSSPLCSVCIDGYASSGSDSFCHKCWHPALSWLVVIAVVLLISFVAYLVIKKTGRNSRLSSVLLRILINYVQVIYVFSKINPLGSELFFDIFSFPNSVGSGFTVDFFPIQCALGWNFYGKWAFYMSLPIAVVLFPFIFFGLDLRFFKYFSSDWSSYLKVYRATVVALLFLFYTQLSNSVFSVFDCYEYKIGDGYPLIASMDLMCYTTPHIISVIFSAFFILLYVIGIPGSAVYIIYTHRDSLQSEAISNAFGFLYSGLKPEGINVYWEVVVISRKIGLIIIATFVSQGYLQTFYSGLLLVAALVAQVLFSPYESSKLNSAETLSLMALYITQGLSLLYYTSNANALALTIILIVLNLFVLCSLCFMILQALYIEKITDNNMTLKDIPSRAKLLVAGWTSRSELDLFKPKPEVEIEELPVETPEGSIPMSDYRKSVRRSHIY